MGLRNSAALVLLVLLILGSFSTVAYDEEGSQMAEVACNNGADDDKDGKIDSEDGGCSQPYYADNSEGNFYDLDASWIFSGKSSPTSTGPSIHYGWKAESTGGTTWPDSGSSQLEEVYVQNSSQTWGGGNITNATITTNGKIEQRNTFSEIIDIPAPSTSNECGEGNPGSGDYSSSGQQNCPQDYGLIADKTMTKLKNDNVFYDIGSSSAGMKCKEPNNNNYPGLDTGSFDADNGDQTLAVAGKVNAPDYFIESSSDNHRIMKINCEKSGTGDIGSQVRDVDFSGQNYNTVSSSLSTITAYSGENATNQVTKCVSASSQTTYTPTEKTVERSTQTKVHNPAESGFYHYEPATTSHTLKISVKVDRAQSDSEYTCDDTTQVYTDCSGGGCSKAPFSYYSDASEPSNEYTSTTNNYVQYSYGKYSLTSPTEELDINSEAAETYIFNDYSMTIHNSGSGDSAGFHPSISDDSKSQGNDESNSFNHYGLTVNTGDGNKFKAVRDRAIVLDADGPEGYGDGYVAVKEGSGGNNIVGSSNKFLAQELKDGSITNDYIGTTNVPKITCSNGTECVASVDVKTTQNGWTSATASSFQFDYQVHGTGASLGTCMMYKQLTDDTSITCLRDNPDGPGGPNGGACGDQAGEHYIYMEGPEVVESLYDDYTAHYQSCVDTTKDKYTVSSCVIHGDIVPEGTMANVTPDGGENYERGGNSPDGEVCLDLRGTGIGNEGDELAGDNKNDDLSQEDYGGEWYDLDSEVTTQYLRGVRDGSYSTKSGRQLVSDSSTYDSNGDGSHTVDDVDWYWRKNSNPHNNKYNPEGNTFGTAIEDDCGNPRFDSIKCNDAASNNNKNPTFYSFLTPSKRDEDFHYLGKEPSDNPRFQGYINKLEDLSNQLESSMNTTVYYPVSVSIWSNSNGGINSADQWAITQAMDWSISSRGVPYPPYATYYRNSNSERSGPESNSVSKTFKVFGNSYAAVADSEIAGTSDQNGNTINEGDGVWIDPDQLRSAWQSGNYKWPSGTYNWTNEMEFKMDITGPDSGIGFNLGDTASLGFKSSSQKEVVWGDIYYEGEYTGSANPKLEKPMCGDDRKEFLLEELGESTKSSLYDGAYACASRRDVCVDKSQIPRIVESGSWSQTDEPDEAVGRLKKDEEFCGKQPSDNQHLWYDQDYGDLDGDGVQDTCDENNLYGKPGIEWIESTYINNNPHAVTGGIDDDWNQYLENEHLKGDKNGQYTSKPGKDSWSSGESPVPTGSPNKTIDTLGFCGGDDSSEYLVTQRCETDMCKTDNSILGVAGDPDKCILDQSEVDGVSGSKRKLYSEGEKVNVDTGSDTKTIACYDGKWYNKWPVVFFREEATISLGSTDQLSFQVINVQNEELTFDLRLSTSNDDLDDFSVFTASTSDKMTVTVPASSSKTYSVKVEGNRKVEPPKEIELQAESRDGGLSGYDTIDVSIENMSTGKPGATYQNSRDVPGIGGIQILVMIMLASTFYFVQLWN